MLCLRLGCEHVFLHFNLSSVDLMYVSTFLFILLLKMLLLVNKPNYEMLVSAVGHRTCGEVRTTVIATPAEMLVEKCYLKCYGVSFSKFCLSAAKLKTGVNQIDSLWIEEHFGSSGHRIYESWVSKRIRAFFFQTWVRAEFVNFSCNLSRNIFALQVGKRCCSYHYSLVQLVTQQHSV